MKRQKLIYLATNGFLTEIRDLLLKKPKGLNNAFKIPHKFCIMLFRSGACNNISNLFPDQTQVPKSHGR